MTAPQPMPGRVSRRTVSPTVVAGGLAASASTGALIAMGRRLGNVRAPFAAIGATLAHTSISSGSMTLVVVGFTIHLVMSFIWAIAFVALVTRGWRLASAGIAIGCGELALSWVIARVTGNGLASVLALGDRVVLAVVIAVSCMVGIWIAVAPSQNVAGSRGLHETSQGETHGETHGETRM